MSMKRKGEILGTVALFPQSSVNTSINIDITRLWNPRNSQLDMCVRFGGISWFDGLASYLSVIPV